MNYRRLISDIELVKNKLIDEESMYLFDAKIDYYISRDYAEFEKTIFSLDKRWGCKELKVALLRKEFKGIILYGCGNDGIFNYKLLKKCGYEVSYFCKTNPEGNEFFQGIPVISVMDLADEYDDYLVIVSSTKYKASIMDQLCIHDIPMNNILWPKYGRLIATNGNQYFDVWDCRKDGEFFVDGGSYNGDTFDEFTLWCNGNYKGGMLFEPERIAAHQIEDRIIQASWKNVSVYNSALWNTNQNLSFSGNGASARVSASKDESRTITGIALDELNSDNVTFIKLDVEGSEWNALEGAKDTIRKNKPKLAVCIYHKPDDIIEIPKKILEICPNYRFKIRHYTSRMWETVLYADVNW